MFQIRLARSQKRSGGASILELNDTPAMHAVMTRSQQMDRINVYLDENRSGLLVCTKCGSSKQLRFPRYVPSSGLVKCHCSNTFTVHFEKRQCYRKPVDIYGTCYADFENADTGNLVKILDISQDGIHLLNVGSKALQPDDTVGIVFPLGDRRINCFVHVLRVHEEYVGGKFIGIDEHTKKTLGFFLLP